MRNPGGTSESGTQAVPPRDGSPAEHAVPPVSRKRPEGALVPADSAASRALVAVIAVLAFLGCLSAGGAEMVASGMREWRSNLSQEATIQVPPGAGRDIEADIARATDIARHAPGIIAAEAVSKGEVEGLLAPWLGRGLDLADLPIPRLIVIKLAPGDRPDLAPLASTLASTVPDAILDDHGVWVARLTRLGRSLVVAASGLVVLVLAAAGAAVAFATRGAMADNREVVEVLRFVGADDRYIAWVFQMRFLRFGLEGGVIGAVAACLFIAGAGVVSATVAAADAPMQLEALLGAFAISWRGYALIAAVPLVVGTIAAAASRRTVARYLSVR